METKIIEVAQRIKGLRQIMDYSQEYMAGITGKTLSEYCKLENGEDDFSFTFLYACANAFGVDIVEILTGETPRLSMYTVVRKGDGLPIKRREGLSYQHLAYRMKNKLSEPFLVNAPFKPELADAPVELSRHKGQEFNYILEGSLKFQLEEHIEILNEGDTIYYNSSVGHGMAATNGKDCKFLAFVLGAPEGEE